MKEPLRIFLAAGLNVAVYKHAKTKTQENMLSKTLHCTPSSCYKKKCTRCWL